MLALRAHQKGLELSCNILPEVPDDLIGDPDRLRQIIVNLVGNAIKFTERGDVVLHVQSDLVADGQATLHFTVTDTGPVGLSLHHRVGVFPDAGVDDLPSILSSGRVHDAALRGYRAGPFHIDTAGPSDGRDNLGG